MCICLYKLNGGLSGVCSGCGFARQEFDLCLCCWKQHSAPDPSKPKCDHDSCQQFPFLVRTMAVLISVCSKCKRTSGHPSPLPLPAIWTTARLLTTAWRRRTGVEGCRNALWGIGRFSRPIISVGLLNLYQIRHHHAICHHE